MRSLLGVGSISLQSRQEDMEATTVSGTVRRTQLAEALLYLTCSRSQESYLAGNEALVTQIAACVDDFHERSQLSLVCKLWRQAVRASWHGYILPKNTDDTRGVSWLTSPKGSPSQLRELFASRLRSESGMLQAHSVAKSSTQETLSPSNEQAAMPTCCRYGCFHNRLELLLITAGAHKSADRLRYRL